MKSNSKSKKLMNDTSGGEIHYLFHYKKIKGFLIVEKELVNYSRFTIYQVNNLENKVIQLNYYGLIYNRGRVQPKNGRNRNFRNSYSKR